jgi:2,4-dienoyl-CoA reductase-like NADH-dependent reductase (Old Yellow Enzyme family)
MASQQLRAASAASLFRPFTAGGLTVPNRIVMAPMTRGFSPDGVPGRDVAAYYARRAANGVGLIITEGTVINHPAAASSPAVPHFHGTEALAGWTGVVEAVHAAGGRIMPQLWHVGTSRRPGAEPNRAAPPIGPSGLDAAGDRVAAPMTEAEIDAVIAAFGAAAASARRTGFDGIELHGAHGYLIDQFLWSRTNRRTDSYGGDLAARTRFAAEVVAECRRAVGPDFPIVFRFSQWKTRDLDARPLRTPADLEQLLGPLVTAGVDLFHCSTRRFWQPEFPDSDLNLAGWTRKLTGRPTVTVGSVGLAAEFLLAPGPDHTVGPSNLDQLLTRLERDEFDLVAVGRALLADPAWAVKVRDGRTDEFVPYQESALDTLV